MKKIIVVGGGISGLSVAWKLSEKGYDVNVIESDKSIGGLAKSIKIENYYFDIGPHSFFTEDKEILLIQGAGNISEVSKGIKKLTQFKNFG